MDHNLEFLKQRDRWQTMKDRISTKKLPVLNKKRKGRNWFKANPNVCWVWILEKVWKCLDTISPEKFIMSNFNEISDSEDSDTNDEKRYNFINDM